MESTSSRELAQALLDSCLNQQAEPAGALGELTRRAMADDPELAGFASQALFGVLIEGLSDRFEPRLDEAYASLFARVLAQVRGADPDALLGRYQAVTEVRRVRSEPSTVFVLSRVTLGADVAITSVVLDAAKQRFPHARIVLVGSEKAWQLFEKDPRIERASLKYPRTGLLADRLAIWPDLAVLFAEPASIVLDTDSRLTQLGLLPVGREDDYFSFPSRSTGGPTDSLAALTLRWVRETLGVDDAVPFLAPKFRFDFGEQPVAAVSFGVGENPAKRLDDWFETEALRLIAAKAGAVIVDRGAGGQEAERVERAIRNSGSEIGMHDGSFASFAALIAAARLYVGYDSAGQHVAGALGVPLVTVFKGFVNDRMFHRWSPDGPGQRAVLRVEGQTSEEVLDRLRVALG